MNEKRESEETLYCRMEQKGRKKKILRKGSLVYRSEAEMAFENNYQEY